MISTPVWFLLVGGLLLFMALTTSRLKSLPITSAIIYLAVGLIVGPTVLNVFHFNPLKQSALLEVLTEVAVLISLFAAGVKMPAPIKLRRWRTPVLLAEGLANDVAEQLRAAISARGEATLVVSGGRSPVAFFQNLAKQGLDWSKVTITLADERWVPVEHADSNAGLLKQHLLQGPAAKAKFLSLYSPAANLEDAAEQADRARAQQRERRDPPGQPPDHGNHRRVNDDTDRRRHHRG